MKVSNGNTIQRIYQEQVKKTQDTGSGDAFKKVMKSSTQQASGVTKPAFHPPSGVNVMNPVFAGKPVQQADPVETMKYAAEVVAAQPDIREERISLLKGLIASGQYNVSPEAVAEKMLGDKETSRVLFQAWEA